MRRGWFICDADWRDNNLFIYILLFPHLESHVRPDHRGRRTFCPAMSRSLIRKVLAVETAEVSPPHTNILLLTPLQGVGARVRRSIGTSSLRNLTPFLMLDHFRVSEGAVSNVPLSQ